MSNTLEVRRCFVAEPMGEKPVTDLAGIGESLGGKMKAIGFDSASTVLGQFLILKKNSGVFMDWMKICCGANSKQAADCYHCLSDWCEQFL